MLAVARDGPTERLGPLARGQEARPFELIATLAQADPMLVHGTTYPLSATAIHTIHVNLPRQAALSQDLEPRTVPMRMDASR